MIPEMGFWVKNEWKKICFVKKMGKLGLMFEKMEMKGRGVLLF